MATQPPQREQTDESLRTERGKVDRELQKKRTAAEEESDAVLAHAHHRADDVLKTARAKADAETRGSTAAIAGERKIQDRTLAQERETAAVQLETERLERRKAFADLLHFERSATDKDLQLERSSADTALGTRDAFLGMVSHDLRNLLSGIALNTSMLVMEAPDEAQRESMIKRTDGIQRAAARMNRLIGDLLDVVSIEAGRLNVSPEPNDLREVIQEALELAEPAAHARDISLSFSSVGEMPTTARFDYDRMLQVVVNLLSNAIKFTPPGGRVMLGLERDDHELRATVTDTGTGIPSDQLEAIFDRFHQVDRTDRRGHGLGLHISRSIVEAHGGSIRAQSDGRGSTFTVTLPV